MITWTFPLSAGVLVRGDAKRHVIMALVARGLEYTVEEHKGMLESLYIFSITGRWSQIQEFSAAIRDWTQRLQSTDHES